MYGVLQPFNLILFVRGFMAGSGLWVAVVARLLKNVNIPLRADIHQLFRPNRHTDFPQVRLAQQ